MLRLPSRQFSACVSLQSVKSVPVSKPAVPTEELVALMLEQRMALYNSLNIF